jgi:hypothetical protein
MGIINRFKRQSGRHRARNACPFAFSQSPELALTNLFSRAKKEKTGRNYDKKT